MPYIKPEDRERLDHVTMHLAELGRYITPGEFNYLVTKLAFAYWCEKPTYTTAAIITGVLENVKQEFYRRVASPYEDAKIAENGDVY